jgi:hypothetical protein
MKTMPKYFAIKNDGSKRFKRYLKWLEEKTGEYWRGDTINDFYGYDGGERFNGTTHNISLLDFSNPVTVLTLDEWEEIINQPQFEVGEEIEVRADFDGTWAPRKYIGYLDGLYWCKSNDYLGVAWEHARKLQKPIVEISVKVNGQEVSPDTISEETWNNIRNNK